jgi:hypothetical protein
MRSNAGMATRCRDSDLSLTQFCALSLIFDLTWSLPTLHLFHPALEDGTDRGYRNVGSAQKEARYIRKRTYIILKTRRKLEIKIVLSVSVFTNHNTEDERRIYIGNCLMYLFFQTKTIIGRSLPHIFHALTFYC